MEENMCPAEERKIIAMAEKTAQLFCTYAENLSRSAETITEACNTPGTKGAAARQMLEVKAAEYHALSGLLHNAAKQFFGAAQRVGNGQDVDRAAEDIKTYAGFLGDQLGKEAEEAANVLSAVRSSRASQQEIEKQAG